MNDGNGLGSDEKLVFHTLHLIQPELRHEIRPVCVKLLKDAPLRHLSISRHVLEVTEKPTSSDASSRIRPIFGSKKFFRLEN